MKRIAIGLVLVVCATSVFAADVKQMIRQKEDGFEAALRAGDADAMAAMYAENAVLMPPNAPAAKGKAAIRGYWAGLLSTASKSDLRLTIDDVSVSGDTAVERGAWKVMVTPKDGSADFNDGGSYVIVWQNRGGKWQAMSDIYNSEKPLPAIAD
jgi:uncharacterized protein (TIGR02246 family)